ncbi:MAG: DUF2794 domain-containing protein [Hyphomicrobiales bacterium]|nr:DUF2794 domain-containing protein [Hyphomicrobiales bacterium]
MNDRNLSDAYPDRGQVVALNELRHTVNLQFAPFVSFNRRELNDIFGIYGRKVAQGEWRDYAIDILKDRAVFSIFRRTSEQALYRIEKNPRLAHKQGAFSVIAASGLILKRGQDLGRVLKVLSHDASVVLFP